MDNYLKPEDDGLLMRPAGPWVTKKLDYLGRYINVFETAMREKWSVRNYIDLLAGPGKNIVRNTNNVLLGSPLLSLTTPHPFTGYYFVDNNDANIQALKQRCATSPFFQRVNIQLGDCNAIVDEIVAQLKKNERKSLNLAFLDPYGMELYWDTVGKLASVQRMDLIIYFPQMGLIRNIKKLYESDEQTVVDLYFGGREWRKVYDEWQGKTGLQRQLINLYKSKLNELGYMYVFQGDEDFGDEPLIRNKLRNAPLYRLIFASKHNLGHKFWGEVVKRDVDGQRRFI